MVDEYQVVLDNNTWKLVYCPQNIKPIGCKWVYRIKYKQNGDIDKYKARLVAKGFVQQEGIDDEETFSIKEYFPSFLCDPLVPVLFCSLGLTSFKS